MSTKPLTYEFPKLFKRFTNQKQQVVHHLILLRENKQYRERQGAALVPGLKMLTELRNEGFEFKSLTVTAEKEPHDFSAIKFPANQVIQNPDAFPANQYYLIDVDLTRRILGTASRPGRHEIFAEIKLPKNELPPKEEVDRMLIFDHVNDPGNLGTLVRTARALDWKTGLTTTGTCDMYNDKTLRASRCNTLRWPHKRVPVSGLVEFLKKYDMTPVVADMLRPDVQDAWSPEDVQGPPGPGTGLWFWNWKGRTPEFPKRPALILSSEHHGVQGLDDELRLSIPMENTESLNVASAGSMLMWEMNRLLAKFKNKN
ncbi:hypothetical protein BCR43DRAFT_483438 [Syncephalastrum racemosum]|uniref:tRNA/rRNA methyltransferase SpoU type domain-containing protein n=1 Tax=Syncephalastrum racemosum TaxID=13706 RepID=A0A1X2HVB4_SYNRA|nr:hypothetical protein BCR43DRAFT_483438 [Syncephalastrum racemosum]